jgi:hypothetical protein
LSILVSLTGIFSLSYRKSATPEKDVTDDRLARVLEQFGLQPEACQEIEQKLGKHLIRAYELPTEVARLDTTSFGVNHGQIE